MSKPNYSMALNPDDPCTACVKRDGRIVAAFFGDSNVVMDVAREYIEWKAGSITVWVGEVDQEVQP